MSTLACTGAIPNSFALATFLRSGLFTICTQLWLHNQEELQLKEKPLVQAVAQHISKSEPFNKVQEQT